jgi:hypothetical protein
MKNIYANLIGEWVNLSDDSTGKITINHKNPYVWLEESDDIFKESHIDVIYKGTQYRLNPAVHIQIVGDNLVR